MIALFVLLYVLSEPFEALEGRWEGIASLSSIVFVQDFDVGFTLETDFYIFYLISFIISTRRHSMSHVLATLFSLFSPFRSNDIVYFYVFYVFGLYQITKMGQNDFLIKI